MPPSSTMTMPSAIHLPLPPRLRAALLPLPPPPPPPLPFASSAARRASSVRKDAASPAGAEGAASTAGGVGAAAAARASRRETGSPVCSGPGAVAAASAAAAPSAAPAPAPAPARGSGRSPKTSVNPSSGGVDLSVMRWAPCCSALGDYAPPAVAESATSPVGGDCKVSPIGVPVSFSVSIACCNSTTAAT